MPAAGGNFCGLKSRIHLEIVISKGFQTLSNDKNAVFHHYNTMLVEKKNPRLRRKNSRTGKVYVLGGICDLRFLPKWWGGNAESSIDLDHPYRVFKN